MQVQPPAAELPLPRVAIGALEVRTAALLCGLDVPAPAALVGDERPVAERGGDGGDEGGVAEDGAQAVVRGERLLLEGGEEGVQCRLRGENEVRKGGLAHF